MPKRKREIHKDSWYWDVLIKNCGSLETAKKLVYESRYRVDPTMQRLGKPNQRNH